MKYILGVLLSIYATFSYAGFLHPMDYTGTDEQNKQIKEYVSQQVKKEQCSMSKDSCESKMKATTVLELEAFQKLAKTTDRKKIDDLLEFWCRSPEEPCYYGIVLMMYDN